MVGTCRGWRDPGATGRPAGEEGVETLKHEAAILYIIGIQIQLALRLPDSMKLDVRIRYEAHYIWPETLYDPAM